MLALAHATRGRPKGAGLKRGNDLFRVAGSFDKNHGYSTRLERFNGARADAAAQYGLTIPQRFDKSGMTVLCGDAITRSASVSMATCIGAGLDEFHLAIPGFKNEELAAASKVGGKVDSIVRWYSDLHVRVSLADTGSIAAFALYMQVASSVGGWLGRQILREGLDRITGSVPAPALLSSQLASQGGGEKSGGGVATRRERAFRLSAQNASSTEPRGRERRSTPRGALRRRA